MPQPIRSWDPSPAEFAGANAAIFFTWASLCIILTGASFWIARGHKDVSGFILIPFIGLALAYDNITLAVDSLNGSLVSAFTGMVPADADAVDGTVVVGLQRVRAAVTSFVIPMLLVAMFELNYEVHKRRSANFFFGCIAFDQGHRTSTGLCGALVRYSLWLVALGVLLIQLVVNAGAMAEPAAAMPRYARWTYLGGRSITSLDSGVGVGWGDAVDFFPMCLLLVFGGYTGASLWRYGTTISTDVRATAVNPWGSMLLATVGLAIAWALTPLTWPLPYAVAALLIALLGALVVTQGCVQSNVAQLEAWEAILATANEDLLVAATARAKEDALRAQQQAQQQRAHGGGRRGAGNRDSARSRESQAPGGMRRQRSWREAITAVAAGVTGGGGSGGGGDGIAAAGAGGWFRRGARGPISSSAPGGDAPGGGVEAGRGGGGGGGFEDLPMGLGTTAGAAAEATIAQNGGRGASGRGGTGLDAGDVSLTFMMDRHGRRAPSTGSGSAQQQQQQRGGGGGGVDPGAVYLAAAMGYPASSSSSTRAQGPTAAAAGSHGRSASAPGGGPVAGGIELPPLALGKQPRPPAAGRSAAAALRSTTTSLGSGPQAHTEPDAPPSPQLTVAPRGSLLGPSSTPVQLQLPLAPASEALASAPQLPPLPHSSGSSSSSSSDPAVAMYSRAAVVAASAGAGRGGPGSRDGDGRVDAPAGTGHDAELDERYVGGSHAAHVAQYHQPKRMVGSLAAGGYMSPAAAALRAKGRGGKR